MSQGTVRGDGSEGPSDPFVGSRLSSYLLLDVLGCGGTCTVYRARHVDLGIEFAVKVLPYGRTAGDLFAERLRREAAAGIRINHPRIVKVLELGMSARGPFLVMELLQGETLRTLLRNGPFAPERAARIVRQTAEGIAAAHRAGFIHRDLKPGNLMVVPHGTTEEVKILDLGIVRVLGAGPDDQLTRDDLILGTPSYMAPEQFQTSNVGPQADLYALGVVLYEMISGRVPFEGSFREIVAQHMILEPKPAPEAEGLGELAAWLMQKTASKRPENAEQVIELIDRRFPQLAEEAAIAKNGMRVVKGILVAPGIAPVARTPVPNVDFATPVDFVVSQELAEEIRHLAGQACVDTSCASVEEPRLDAAGAVAADQHDFGDFAELDDEPSISARVDPEIVREANLETKIEKRSITRRFGPRSRFYRKPRRSRWPLRMAMPLAWSLAIVGAVFAAQYILHPTPAPAETRVVVDRAYCEQVYGTTATANSDPQPVKSSTIAMHVE